MGISLKIAFGSRRRPGQKTGGQESSGEGSSRKHTQDHGSRDPPPPCQPHKPESIGPPSYIVQPRRPSYNVREVRPSTAPQKPHLATHTMATTTPSLHCHRRSSISIHSPPCTSCSYVEPSTRRRHRRSSQLRPPNSPVSPLGTSRFELLSPWRQAQPAIQRDEYGFSIRTPSTRAGEANAHGMSALAPVNSDEYSYFEP